MGKKHRSLENAPPPKPRPSPAQWIQKHATLVFVGLLALASLRVVATYSVFNHTLDEPAHIACGMQWLDQGVYTYESQHPPLARVAAALGPFLLGRRTTNLPDKYQEGAAILYGDGHYERNLTLSRLAILPFFWIACFVLYAAAKSGLGEPVALVAVFLFSFLPPVLAHAGLATTDMPLTAMLAASFVTGLMWLEQPCTRRSALFGACTGLAILSKFSIFVFLPAAAVAALLCYLAAARPAWRALPGGIQRGFLPLLFAVAAALMVIWAGYRFSIGKVDFAGLTLPFPELFDGIRTVIAHNATGHPAYLLGERSQFGWWYYYPVVLAVKTPLPFLALLFIGIAVSLSKSNRARAAYWLPMAFSLGIFFVSFVSHINIGVRHILPVYLGFSITAAIGAVWLYQRSAGARWALWILGALLVWHAAGSLISHPDYIPYTNLLAGNSPEKILVDSDLDWGQDMNRLGKRLRELGVRQVAFNPLIVGYLEEYHGFPPITLMQPTRPSPGWNAASLTVMLAGRLGLGDQFPKAKLWTTGVPPTERVGKTTYLWYIANPDDYRRKP
ncbi:MAG: glycosyltransferase family 39 protein [Candidatus Solibacter sp.]